MSSHFLVSMLPHVLAAVSQKKYRLEAVVLITAFTKESRAVCRGFEAFAAVIRAMSLN